MIITHTIKDVARRRDALMRLEIRPTLTFWSSSSLRLLAVLISTADEFGNTERELEVDSAESVLAPVDSPSFSGEDSVTAKSEFVGESRVRGAFFFGRLRK